MQDNDSLLSKAIAFAANAHCGAKRKGTDVPYILHPLEAAAITGTMTQDREALAAAVLHDVLEDTPVTIKDLAKEFPGRVCEYVYAVSEDKRTNECAAATWEKRKQETIDAIHRETRLPVLMIELGDKLSNMRAIARDYLIAGDALWERFNQKDKKKHEWYYRSLTEALDTLDVYPAWREMDRLVHEVFSQKEYMNRKEGIFVTNDVLNVIRTRRSIRRFKPEQIKRDELDAILEAATWAPSGSNSQAWLFTAIQNPKALETLRKLVRERVLTWQLPENAYRGKTSTFAGAQREEYSFFHSAPTLIIASNIDYTNTMADCSLALGNMFLAATSLGIGSCWINPIAWMNDDEPVRSYLATLGIPRDRVICGSAAIGYIDGDMPKPPPRKPNTIAIIE